MGGSRFLGCRGGSMCTVMSFDCYNFIFSIAIVIIVEYHHYLIAGCVFQGDTNGEGGWIGWCHQCQRGRVSLLAAAAPFLPVAAVTAILLAARVIAAVSLSSLYFFWYHASILY